MTLNDTYYVPASAIELAPFVNAGLFDASCVYLVDTVARGCGGLAPIVQLGAALAARAPQHGHVCVPIDDIERSIMSEDLTNAALAQLPWPHADEWRVALRTSLAVWIADVNTGDRRRPLVLDGSNLYLNRYWNYEQQVASAIRERVGERGVVDNDVACEQVLDELVLPDTRSVNPAQLGALRNALSKRFSVIAGGPGTGKTSTIAAILLAMAGIDASRNRPLRIGLAAPTGKAASRMSDAIGVVFSDMPPSFARPNFIQQLQAVTIQRLLGSGFDGKFRFDASNPLPFDVVIVDEASMISLPLMHRLLLALRADASLIVVGDPDQLASIEAGAVLADIMAATDGDRARRATPPGPLEGSVSVLSSMHRFSDTSQIGTCAALTSTGATDALLELLHSCHEGDPLRYVEHTDTSSIAGVLQYLAVRAREAIVATSDGDPLLGLSLLNSCKALCATRRGDYGTHEWSTAIERAVAPLLPEVNLRQRWYCGKPLIATKNDYANEVFNGEVGVIADHDGQAQIAMERHGIVRWLGLAQWSEAEPWWTMTIHRSQGSEFDEVVIVLPEVPMALLTRELLYTAITRAKRRLTIIGNDDVIRTTLERRIGRSTGLAALLHD